VSLLPLTVSGHAVQVMICIAYGLVGLPTSPRILLLFLISGCIVNLIGNQVAILAVHMTSNSDAAMLLIIMYDVIALQLAGYYVRLSSLPVIFRLLSYVSPLRYSFGLATKEVLQVRGSLSSKFNALRAASFQFLPIPQN
jgi:ABC-2 type transporter